VRGSGRLQVAGLPERHDAVLAHDLEQEVAAGLGIESDEALVDEASIASRASFGSIASPVQTPMAASSVNLPTSAASRRKTTCSTSSS